MTETASYSKTNELRIIEFPVKEKKNLRCGVFSSPAWEWHLENEVML